MPVERGNCHPPHCCARGAGQLPFSALMCPLTGAAAVVGGVPAAPLQLQTRAGQCDIRLSPDGFKVLANFAGVFFLAVETLHETKH